MRSRTLYASIVIELLPMTTLREYSLHIFAWRSLNTAPDTIHSAAPDRSSRQLAGACPWALGAWPAGAVGGAAPGDSLQRSAVFRLAGRARSVWRGRWNPPSCSGCLGLLLPSRCRSGRASTGPSRPSAAATIGGQVSRAGRLAMKQIIHSDKAPAAIGPYR